MRSGRWREPWSIGLVPKRRTAFIFDPAASIDPAWPVVIDVDEAFYFKPESGLLLGSPADETNSPSMRCAAGGAGCRHRGRPHSIGNDMAGRSHSHGAGPDFEASFQTKRRLSASIPSRQRFLLACGPRGLRHPNGARSVPIAAAALLPLAARLPDDIAATGLQAGRPGATSPHALIA